MTPSSVLLDGMHRGGLALPGASMETQAELGPLTCMHLFLSTYQAAQGQAGMSPCAVHASSIKWAVQPLQKARRHLAHGWRSLWVNHSVPDTESQSSDSQVRPPA